MYGKVKEKNLYYWVAEGSAKAEVDFIVQDDDKYIIPIEVKSGTAKRARSLTRYCEDEMTNKILPLYAFWRLKDWIK
jgi:predicted AAA+ superfamily ATPase